MLADLANGFQEERLPTRPLVLQQDDGMAQRHVVPAVREGSQLKTSQHQVQAVGHDGLAGTRQKLQIRTFSKLGLYFEGSSWDLPPSWMGRTM